MLEIAVIGVVISSFFIEFTGFYPGGIVVPVWLSFYIDQPYRLIGTMLISLLCLLVYKVLRKYLFLYGRRRFVIMVLLSASFTLIFRRFLPITVLYPVELQSVGWIIPGLIANTMERQGVLITVAAMYAVSLTIRLVVSLVL